MKWTVRLEGVYPGTEDDFTLTFTNIRDIAEPLSVKRYMIQAIADIAQEKDHYSALPNIKEIISDQKETLPHDRASLVLATYKKRKEKIGFLLYLRDEFTYEIKGVWPAALVDKIRQNDKKIIEILTQLTDEPDLFEDVSLVLPESRF